MAIADEERGAQNETAHAVGSIGIQRTGRELYACYPHAVPGLGDWGWASEEGGGEGGSGLGVRARG